MFGRSIGITSICVLGAQAFLLPPELSASRHDAAVEPILDPKSQSIHLPCPACTFSSREASIEEAEENDDLFWIQGRPNDIVLNFRISDDGERLEADGQPIYPPRFHRDAYLQGQPIYVYQVSASASDVEILSGEARSVPLQVTSSGLKIEAEQSISSGSDAIIPLRFQIMGLDRQPIELDEVAVDLLRTGDGELLIMRVENLHNAEFLPFSFPHALDEASDERQCSMLPSPICNFKKMVEAKIAAMRHGHFSRPRPCPGSFGPPGQLPDDMEPNFGKMKHEGKSREHHGRPHHMRPYWRHEHHSHGFFRAFARGLIAILIPVFAGITVGLSVSFLGLLVGRVVGYLWIKFARGGRRGYIHLPVDEAMQDSGKIFLYKDDPEPLQAYEDAPPYEERECEKR